MFESAQKLFANLIDFAGLFPPKELDMPTALGDYRHYREGSGRAILGRLVVPVGRLDEFDEHAREIVSTTQSQWLLSVVIPSAEEAHRAVDRIKRFISEHSQDPALGNATIDAIEIPVSSPEEIVAVTRELPEEGIVPYFEVTMPIEPADIHALAESGASAKIRLGGEVIPEPFRVQEFMRACVEGGIAFKASAGLHHPFATRDGETITEYGFIPLLLAAAFIFAYKDEVSPEDIIQLLGEQQATAFSFREEKISWLRNSLDIQQLQRGREFALRSIGSCDFSGPLRELVKLDLVRAEAPARSS